MVSRPTLGIFLVFLTCPAFLSALAMAETHLVRADGSGQFASIHEAIAAAGSQDTVRVGPGSYAEPDLVLKNRMRLENEEGAEPVVTGVDGPLEIQMAEQSTLTGFRIQGVHILCVDVVDAGIIENHVEGTAFRALTIGRSKPRIEGNTIIADPESHTCIWVDAASPEFVGNFISMGAPNSSGSAIEIAYPGPFDYSETVVRDNVISGRIYVQGGWEYLPPIIVTGNLIINPDSYSTCISISNSPIDIRIYNNTILSGVVGLNGESHADIAYNVIGFDSGVATGSSCYPTLRHNLFFGNDRDFAMPLEYSVYERNLYGNPDFCDPEAGVYTVTANSPCLPGNNPFDHLIGAFGLGCDVAPAEILLRADGTGDYPTIQAAIDAMGQERTAVIDLADGVYTGAGNRDITFAYKHISLRSASGNRDACIIDCRGTRYNPHRAFGLQRSEQYGSLELVDVSIVNGFSGDRGGAVALRGSLSLRGCAFRACTAGVSGFTTEQGGAVAGAGGLVVATPPVISQIFWFQDTIFEGCSAYSGGAVFVSGKTDVTVANCTFYANRSNGGALQFQDGVLATVANTVITHSEAGPGFGVSGRGVDTVFLGSDLFANAGGDWIGDVARFLDLDCNISADPLYCAPVACGDLGADLHLVRGSPCLPEGTGCGERMGALGLGCESPAVPVHPGDADNNGVVDGFDVIPLGLHFLEEGSPRTCDPYVWEGQSGLAWPVAGSEYADTDGSGRVDEQDLFAIGLNWGKTHDQGSGSAAIDPATLDLDPVVRENFTALYRSLAGTGESASAMKALLEEILDLEAPDLPARFAVHQNHPNPFNPRTTIVFDLPRRDRVTLGIYDLAGRLVATVLADQPYDPGRHAVEISSEQLGSGVYFYRLRAGQDVAVRKMTVMK